MKVILKRKHSLEAIRLGGLTWTQDGDVYVNENVSEDKLKELKAGYCEDLFEAVKEKKAKKSK